jgi:uncharacterized Zn-binding protein involved in type VI secretion
MALAVAVSVLVVGGPTAAQGGSVLDRIADGTYDGTLGDFEFRSSITVLDAAGTLTKLGDTLSWSWSVEWEQALVDCAYINRDSWSGSDITLVGDDFVNVSGERVFDVDLSTTCGGPSGDIASAFESSFRLDLVDSDLTGTIGIGRINFAVQLADAPTESGVVERDGILFITSPPGGTLEISRSDLPDWAGWRIATVGALSAGFGGVKSGDPNVLLDGLPIARMDDRTNTDAVIISAAPNIFVNGRPAARIGDDVRGLLDGNLQVTPFVAPLITTGPCGNYEPDGTPDVSEIYAACDPPLAMAITEADASSGGTVLDVDSSRFKVGDTVVVGSGETRDKVDVSALGSLIFSSPLVYDHPVGTLVMGTDRIVASTPPGSGGGQGLWIGAAAVIAAAFAATVFLRRRIN